MREVYELDKKIDEYSEELFLDLGVASLSEEQKADLYARVQEHFHKIILSALAGAVSEAELIKIRMALDQENYAVFGQILKNHPEVQANLEEKIDSGFNQLKFTIREEQTNAA